MKKYFLFICFVVFALVACNESPEKISTSLVKNPKTAGGTLSEKMPVITFEVSEHDFGKLIQGEQVSCIFKFKNTGDAPLLINNVAKSCGCTVTKFSKDPIAPNAEGTIEVTFNSSGLKGNQNKTITVISNTHPSKTYLKIKAQVTTPDKY
ncbi:MAG: DUF1573 domain-containing protein [Lentimicrobiaceae bacterium]|jgi:hypothetical protein|nr:DUF1573 domain-containing protein [Lentimicrobiaceae bacterium]